MTEDQTPFGEPVAQDAAAALRRILETASERRELMRLFEQMLPDKRRLLLHLARAAAGGVGPE